VGLSKKKAKRFKKRGKKFGKQLDARPTYFLFPIEGCGVGREIRHGKGKTTEGGE